MTTDRRAEKQAQIERRLSGLSLVLLTHRHVDHLDPGLIRALRQLPIRWVIPDPILPLVLEQTGLSES